MERRLGDKVLCDRVHRIHNRRLMNRLTPQARIVEKSRNMMTGDEVTVENTVGIPVWTLTIQPHE